MFSPPDWGSRPSLSQFYLTKECAASWSACVRTPGTHCHPTPCNRNQQHSSCEGHGHPVIPAPGPPGWPSRLPGATQRTELRVPVVTVFPWTGEQAQQTQGRGEAGRQPAGRLAPGAPLPSRAGAGRHLGTRPSSTGPCWLPPGTRDPCEMRSQGRAQAGSRGSSCSDLPQRTQGPDPSQTHGGNQTRALWVTFRGSGPLLWPCAHAVILQPMGTPGPGSRSLEGGAAIPAPSCAVTRPRTSERTERPALSLGKHLSVWTGAVAVNGLQSWEGPAGIRRGGCGDRSLRGLPGKEAARLAEGASGGRRRTLSGR